MELLMYQLYRKKMGRFILRIELIVFCILILLPWLDEFIDLPHLILNATATPVNWREALIESILVLLLGIYVVVHTHTLMRKLKSLEGILPICASCKRIRDGKDQWYQLEAYIRDHSEAQFSHSICPDCAKELYPELDTAGRK